MTFDFLFILNSILFGVGLAMDAFSVSIVNGMNEQGMSAKRVCAIASVYCGFQIAMPLIGWVCVHTIANIFTAFQKAVPWIALILLLLIGGQMLIEGIKNKKPRETDEAVRDTIPARLGFSALMVQGVATSIDALSVGFTISEYPWYMALLESLIIGAVTFGICFAGLRLGGKIGEKIGERAKIFGGIILICIGIEIFVRGIL